LYFWVFFAIVLAVYSIVHKKRGLRNFYIFLISLFFYYKTSGFFFFILLFSTLTDYIIGLAIHKTDEPLKKKLLVAASIVVNLFLLVYFKYAHFFTENINQIFGTDLEVINYFAHWANLTTL
jgi:D-alanyl-lipoteichoic acid acyltransferase DltB (MBOAT superfamily)